MPHNTSSANFFRRHFMGINPPPGQALRISRAVQCMGRQARITFAHNFVNLGDANKATGLFSVNMLIRG